jgi:hypothetical protein
MIDLTPSTFDNEGDQNTDAGAIIDPAMMSDGQSSSGLQFFIDLGLKLGKGIDKNTDVINELKAAYMALQRDTPFVYQTVASGTFTSGELLLNLGSPDQGTYWEVEMIAVGGTDIGVSAAGSAGIYVTASPGNTGGLMNLNDFAAYLPNVGFYGSQKLVLKDQENLMVGIVNGTNGQVYVATARVSVVNVAAGQGVSVTAL